MNRYQSLLLLLLASLELSTIAVSQCLHPLVKMLACDLVHKEIGATTLNLKLKSSTLRPDFVVEYFLLGALSAPWIIPSI